MYRRHCIICALFIIIPAGKSFTLLDLKVNNSEFCSLNREKNPSYFYSMSLECSNDNREGDEEELLRLRQVIEAIQHGKPIIGFITVVSSLLNSIRNNGFTGMSSLIRKATQCYLPWCTDIGTLLTHDIHEHVYKNDEQLSGLVEFFNVSQYTILAPLIEKEYITTADNTTMILNAIDIHRGTAYLVKLQELCESLCSTQNVTKCRIGLENLKLYIRVVVFKLFLLGQMYTVFNSHVHDSNNSQSHITEDLVSEMFSLLEQSKHFLKVQMRPSVERATVFSLYHKTEYEEIELFLREHDLNLPNVEKYLIGKNFTIQEPSPRERCMHLTKRNRIMRGTIRNAGCNQGEFCFESIGQDDIFYIKLLKWPMVYVYVHENKYLYGTTNIPGDEGKFKIIRLLDNGNIRFIISVLKWPGCFLYISLFRYIRIERLGKENPSGGRFLWEFKE